MTHYNTILHQIIALVPSHVFDQQAALHHSGQKFRSYNRWSQFMAMLIGQLSGRRSLRDIIDNLKAQGRCLYHLGMKRTSRATLARVNRDQPASLYEAIFNHLLKQCRAFAPSHKFSFKNKVYLLDATVIDLCLALFPWAEYRTRKGAVKLHMGIDADGYLPEFMHLTDGKFHEIKWAKKMLALPKGSFAVFDRGFNDYGWFSRLDRDGVFFVTRLKKNADVEFLTKRSGRKSSGISNDQQIRLNGVEAPLRLVQCIDPETGQEYRFLTNAHHLKAAEIAALYKERWQIEQFFKWIKQNLRIKTFLGTSKNAVLTQIWIALCAYLMIAFLNFKAKLGISMQRILRVLQLNLFSRCDLEELFKPLGGQPADSKYISLWV
jgi:hypothetical protein